MTNADTVTVTPEDIAAWERYGPAIFHCEMTGPEALARHRTLTPAKAAGPVLLEASTKRALWLLMEFPIMRYLMANTHGRLDGAEKAQRHAELTEIYCKVCLGIGRGYGLSDSIDPRKIHHTVHDATQAMTSHMDEAIGFPVFDRRPDYDKLAPLFFEQFLALALAAITQAEGPQA